MKTQISRFTIGLAMVAGVAALASGCASTKSAGASKEERVTLAQLPQQAQPIATRQHDVENERIERRAADSGERVIAVVANVHGETFRLKRLADERGGFLFVFDDQHAHSLIIFREQRVCQRKGYLPGLPIGSKVTSTVLPFFLPSIS